MHRTRIEVEGHPFDLFHNGDFSGDVKVFDASARGDDGFVCELPYELMEGLVLAKLRQELVNKLEQMEQSEFRDLLKVLL